jgi:hypothetical protein
MFENRDEIIRGWRKLHIEEFHNLNTLILCSSLNVRGQVSHPYRRGFTYNTIYKPARARSPEDGGFCGSGVFSRSKSNQKLVVGMSSE